MLSKSTLDQHQQQSTEWWLMALQKKSLREIAKESNLHYSSVRRRLVKYYGADYAEKAKSSLVRSLSESIEKAPSKSRSRDRMQQEAKEWLTQNMELLADLYHVREHTHSKMNKYALCRKHPLYQCQNVLV